MSFARVTTGEFTDDVLDIFRSRAVITVPQLQDLLKYIVENGFENHVAMSGTPSAQILAEAFETYKEWDIYTHNT